MMWLINTKTWELEEIINPQKGSYAILSHTWEDGEVSFQQYKELRKAAEMTEFDEILKKLGERKGLHKVLKTVEMARTRGLEYAWVDTCCIDKSSSAELSEAINSMFKWYEDAAVCFAYLSDLPTIEHICTSTQANSDDKKQRQKELFRHCYWFSRGWTLQELIAPETVEFYDSEWKCYGTKAMLKETISSITKIPKHVLDKFIPLQTVTIAQRMSWAADRSTTRVEDMAYCLMGLFDLNMTLLYGEGYKAFIRLQEEICKESTDLSLFAWRSESRVDVSTPSQKYRGVLASSPSEFRGCNNIYSTSNSKRHKGEFQITNRGLRLDECRLCQEGGFLVLVLDCFEILQSYDARHVGIALTETPYGFFRSQSHTFKYIKWLKLERLVWRNETRIYIAKVFSPEASVNLDKDSITLTFENMVPHKIFTSAQAQHDPVQKIVFCEGDDLRFAILVDQDGQLTAHDKKRFLIFCHYRLDHEWGNSQIHNQECGRRETWFSVNVRHFKNTEITEDQRCERITAALEEGGPVGIGDKSDYSHCYRCRDMVCVSENEDSVMCGVRMVWRTGTEHSGGHLHIAFCPLEKGKEG